MERIPWSHHFIDLRAYAICATFVEASRIVDRQWASEFLMPLWWRQLIAFDGPSWRLTLHGADFCETMDKFLARRDGDPCSACGGIYHPATGHVLSVNMRLCGPCARNMSTWVKRHVSKRWSKGDFYGAAVNSARVP